MPIPDVPRQSAQEAPPAGAGSLPPEPIGSGRSASAADWARSMTRVRNTAALYLLMLPTLIGLAVFSYWPKIDVFRFAFYRWIPEAIEEFIGFNHFISAWNDTRFRESFFLVFLLLAANLVKMLPSMSAAIVLHRVRSDRARYFFQVCFVVPMVIPGLVWLLLWKGFMDPNFGLVNAALNGTGGMQVLVFLDNVMYRIADTLYPVAWGFDWLLSDGADRFMSAMPDDMVARPAGIGLWGLLLAGSYLMLFIGGLEKLKDRWFVAAPIIVTAILIWGDRSWFLVPAIAVAALATRRHYGRFIADERLRWTGLVIICLAGILILFTKVWDHRIGAFDTGNPAWLGHSDLVIPAVIFWGFPWVHAVGVLIYLAGLQQISQDVYEAAELDGLGTIGQIFRIELPLIMTQIRINLIFMTIGTLNTYAFFLILLGPEGGPGGRGMVPGLYMYQQAFVSEKFGYACALGLIMFFIILALTIIYQRYVKVDK